jgi:hypothetical protein
MNGIDRAIGNSVYRPSPIFLNRIALAAEAKGHPGGFVIARERNACEACNTRLKRGIRLDDSLANAA